MVQCYSLNLSHSFLPPLSLQVCFLHLHLYFCPANRFFSTIFLDSMCTHYYTIFVFLFLAYFTLFHRFIRLIRTDSNLFLFMAE